MATFIALIDYTDQGIQAIQNSPERATAFLDQAKAAGVEVKDLYWTWGAHDGLIVVEAPDEETASALFLSVSKQGNVRTQMMRAFDRNEFQGILSKMK